MLLDHSARPMLDLPDKDEYVEVELRLRDGGGGDTAVELRANPGVVHPETRVRLDLAALASLGPPAYGEELGRQLFEGTELGEQYAGLRIALDSRDAKWRLRLRLDDPALQEVHWERLCQRNAGAWSPIGAGGAIPFSRFIYVTGWKPARPLTDRPIRTLFVAATTGVPGARGLPAIPTEERDAMRQAVGAPGDAEVKVRELVSGGTERPTLATLRAALAWEPAIVHVLCHGLKGPAGTALVLEDATGKSVAVPTADLLDAFQAGATPPRFVLLAACESAAYDGARAFVSMGSTLAAAGVDAVVAMSAPIAVSTARDFCTAFYQRLFTHGVVDRAVNEARAAVRDAWDWSVPVLFSCLADQQVLDFAVGRVHAEYLDVSDRVARSVAMARNRAQSQGAAGAIIEAMNDLIAELEKSHEVLTKVTTEFRRTARDPADFPKAFSDFRADFKQYYDNKTWLEERTRCHEVEMRAAPALELVRHSLSADDFRRFEEDLRSLSDADRDILRHLGDFLDRMDVEVEEIASLLANPDVAGALERHRAFDIQISPSFRKSKALLTEIGDRAHRVTAA